MRPRLAFVFGLLVLVSSAWADDGLFETTLWARKTDGYFSHFVYGIVVTPRGTVLVASEARLAGADAGPKDILIRRSTDRGVTWSTDVAIEPKGEGKSWSNPTFVQDGSLTYLIYSWSVTADLGRVFVRTSADDGLTWGERQELTSLWDKNDQGWTQHSAIGHGLRKTRSPGAGSLFVAFSHRGAVELPPEKRGYGVDIVAHTASGWAVVGRPKVDVERSLGEAELAERSDGALLLVSRQGRLHGLERGQAVSRDAGVTWSDWATVQGIGGTACDGGLLGYDGDTFLYSYPSGKSHSAKQRRDLRIGFSQDGGTTWQAGRLLHAGQSTYSDLARDAAGNIYCVFGRDGNDFMGDSVELARFGLPWAIATGPAANSQ